MHSRSLFEDDEYQNVGLTRPVRTTLRYGKSGCHTHLIFHTCRSLARTLLLEILFVFLAGRVMIYSPLSPTSKRTLQGSVADYIVTARRRDIITLPIHVRTAQPAAVDA